jgi:hypothetical protein
MSIKRQHYVPQGFLKGFHALNKESDKFIWVYEKLPNRKPRCVSSKSIAWSSFYYAQEKEDGEVDTDSLEKMLGQALDNVIPEIIRSIDTKAGSPVQISEENQGTLAFFIGLSMTRVPNFREGTRDFYSKIAQLLLNEAAKKDDSVREFIEKYGPVKAEAKEWVSLEPMINVASEIGKSILEKHWQFFIPPKNLSLITSDNPVHFSISKETGFKMAGPCHPLSEIVIHLRSNLALVCTYKNCGVENQTFSLSKQETKKFNRGMAKAAGRFVFANEYNTGIENLTKKYSNESQSIIV